MAVKVMVAPAIANGEIGRPAPAPGRRAGSPPKPRRRRSSVYDADGNEVFITLICLKCHKTRPLSQFGLRKMADGAIRNQPWCRTCRSAAGGETARRREPIAAPPQPVEEPPPIRRPASSVAAEVAAVLAAGMKR